MKEAEQTFSHLYNTPTDRHVCLVVNRHKKEARIDSLANLRCVGGFKYFDTVHIWYEKASGASNTSFMPLCETGYLFYKGETPDVKRTAWFSEDQTNATNLWPVSPNEGEQRSHTYYQKFNFETALLVHSLTLPSSNRRFIYGMDGHDENLFAFCHQHKIGVFLCVSTAKKAEEVLDDYEHFVSRIASNMSETAV
ncbi:hypothetical protein UFOVP244_25 [uncultured Caudovirales phage]|uniref:Uncharacterized protein n=1 Tax=uncultured Caudovirales phage TaxID=2100421 RepID=A0A6J7WSK9_9CAUD|nr:hypothetical protein UFOVP244_25 [uncultured Caudovirales phage]